MHQKKNRVVISKCFFFTFLLLCNNSWIHEYKMFNQNLLSRVFHLQGTVMVSVAMSTIVLSSNVLRFSGYFWDDEIRRRTLSLNQHSIAGVGSNFPKLWLSSEILSKESSWSWTKQFLQSVLILAIRGNILWTFVFVKVVINNISNTCKTFQLSLRDLYIYVFRSQDNPKISCW